MRVSIIGAGYVGLVTGVCLAEKGHEVVCVDVDRSKVERLTRGEAPIHEVGLGELLELHAGKRFSATTDLVGAVRNSDVTFIAVGTPFDGAAIDLTYVVNAARQVGAALAEKSGHPSLSSRARWFPARRTAWCGRLWRRPPVGAPVKASVSGSTRSS